MIPTPLARAVAFATASTCLTLPTLAQAEFIKDSVELMRKGVAK